MYMYVICIYSQVVFYKLYIRENGEIMCVSTRIVPQLSLTKYTYLNLGGALSGTVT